MDRWASELIKNVDSETKLTIFSILWVYQEMNFQRDSPHYFRPWEYLGKSTSFDETRLESNS